MSITTTTLTATRTLAMAIATTLEVEMETTLAVETGLRIGHLAGTAIAASTQPVRGSGGRDQWQHNPEHRGGAPYRDRAAADRFGGTARGDSLGTRQAGARQQVGRQGGNLSSTRGGGAGVSNRASDG